jgi:hypothetical protein
MRGPPGSPYLLLYKFRFDFGPHPHLTVLNPISNDVFDSCARCSAQWHPQT